jgi:hypothetical protein
MKTIRPRENWDINFKDITVWDNFFTDECLKILRYRILYAKYFDTQYDGYAAIHCDPSIVNINIWVSADTIIKDESKNGLMIYKIKPPEAWKRSEWNGSKNGMGLKYIQSLNVKPTQVPYKSNRAIFFDGAYFHNSNNVSTKKGFENKRISYTMLFGSQLE